MNPLLLLLLLGGRGFAVLILLVISPALREEGEHVAQVPRVLEHGLVGGVVLKGDANVLRVATNVDHLRRHDRYDQGEEREDTGESRR